MPLVVCPGCQRHVKADDGSCPFCGEAELPAARSVRVPPGASRAAMLLIGMSVTSASACGDETVISDSASSGDASSSDASVSSTDVPSSMAVYGGPTFVDSSSSTGNPSGGGQTGDGGAGGDGGRGGAGGLGGAGGS